jgi:hypothetical protein
MLLKIVAFERTIRNFLNTLAIHIEGVRHPTIRFFTLFSCQCPIMDESISKWKLLQFSSKEWVLISFDTGGWWKFFGRLFLPSRTLRPFLCVFGRNFSLVALLLYNTVPLFRAAISPFPFKPPPSGHLNIMGWNFFQMKFHFISRRR